MIPEDRMRVMEACLVLPGQGWVMHFGLMMLMSVLVAIMGLSANSPALVIGAMLIAPLMTPVLGIAASIAMALVDALTRAITTVVLATVGAILLAWVIAHWLPGELLTGEVLSRTAPDARDLVVALAAGLAGSYATARPDVSSSLPGVAIAVALVPPLAVVGITLQAGEADLARGALLLYGTNLAAIVTVSTVVFIVTGFVPSRRLLTMAPRVVAGALIGLAVVGALGVLLVTRSIDSNREVRTAASVRQATETWLGGTFNDSEVDVNGTRVAVQVIGSERPPETADLQRELDTILGEPAELSVSWIQGQTAEAIEVSLQARRQIEETNVVEVTVQEWLASTGTGDVYEVTDLTATGDQIIVEIASASAPPSSLDLSSRLDEKLGVAPAAEVRWRDLSAEAAAQGQASIDEIEADARRVAQEWASERDLVVDRVTFDADALVVDLAGAARPDGESLEASLRQVVGVDASIDVGFVQRQSVIPPPTATPVPTPTATPVPSPTAVPTVTATATPEASPTPG